MKRTQLIIGLMTALSVGLYGQSGTSQQQGAQPAQSEQGQQRERDAQQSTADTPGATEAAAGANNNNEEQTNGNDERASNTPAVPQTTTSQSGSPAVLSGNNGEDRDGTNSVQRASMNMAGSPADNLNLDDKRSQGVDSESKDRHAYEQEKAMSEQNKSRQSGANPGSGRESDEINEKTRRENNADSDQNLSAKDKSEQTKSDKAKRKFKRNKSRG